jgi:hypothetical protein
MLCESESAHIAKASLISFLRARPAIQMWHEALLSEIYDENEPNLPSVLEGTDFLNPVVQRFQEYFTRRSSLMTQGDIFVARCVVVDFIYQRLGDAQAAAQLAKDAQQKKILEEQGMAVRRREQARRQYELSSLRFGSAAQEKPPIGQIGVQDLTALLRALFLESPPELSTLPEPVCAPAHDVPWVKSLACSLAQLTAEAMPPCFHFAT